MLDNCFSSAFGIKQEHVSIPYDMLDKGHGCDKKDEKSAKEVQIM